MDTNKILSADLIDLIFDDRNKDYGAYQLRRTYDRRVKKSLLFTGLLVAVTCTGVVLANKPTKSESRYLIKPPVIITSVVPDEPEPLPPPPPPEPEPQRIQTEQFTTPDIVDDTQVDDPPPAQTDLENSRIGLEDIAGRIDDNIITVPNLDEGKDIIEDKPQNENPVFIPIEVEARFDGDWAKFLFKHLNPQVPIDNGAPAGRYTVMLQFMVDIDGSVSDIKALTRHGYGLEEEAIRVIRKSKNWEPAIQNGRKVKAYRKQPITFEIAESN